MGGEGGGEGRGGEGRGGEGRGGEGGCCNAVVKYESDIESRK